MRALFLSASVFLFGFEAVAQKLKLSTDSDSALYYYYEGWRQVMDEGDYTASEKIYRKMMASDPSFLVGLSLVGRITRNLQERLAIAEQLEKRKKGIQGDERLLLDNYIELVKLTNLRETDPSGVSSFIETSFRNIERNLTVIVHRYPDEIYYKAEYIEVLHRNHGPHVALDSLNALATPSQQAKPFLLGYAAHLLAEIGEFESALAKARLLERMFNHPSPKPHAVLADVYFKMGKLYLAAEETKQALQLDPGNIDSQRLMKQINKAGIEK